MGDSQKGMVIPRESKLKIPQGRMSTQEVKKIVGQADLDLAYLAGFIDGDGCILAQLVRRTGYKYKYQVKVSVTMYQKSVRHWFLLELQNEIGGNIRQKESGMSELTVISDEKVKALLIRILPYLRMKKKTAELLLEIIADKEGVVTKSDFIALCKKVDKVAEHTDSRGRKNTAALVEMELAGHP